MRYVNYTDIVLKDGREGTIVEVLNGAYLVEIDPPSEDADILDCIIEVTDDDIKQCVERYDEKGVPYNPVNCSVCGAEMMPVKPRTEINPCYICDKCGNRYNFDPVVNVETYVENEENDGAKNEYRITKEQEAAKAKYEQMLAQCKTATDKQLVEHTWKMRPTLQALEELEDLCL